MAGVTFAYRGRPPPVTSQTPRSTYLLFSLPLLVGLAACGSDAAVSDAPPEDTSALGASRHHLRYLAMNVGNADVRGGCTPYEDKLCAADVSQQIRAYIATWKPDVILISEVMDEPQLTRTIFESDVKRGGDASKNLGGPILPDVPAKPYGVSCHASIDRDTGLEDAAYPMDNPKGSHRHECVVYDTKKFGLRSVGHVFGSNADAWDKTNCHYDFTARSADLELLGSKDEHGEPIVITAIAIHPPSNPISSAQKKCRMEEIGRAWSTLAAGKKRVIIGGDWNTQRDDELQVPSGFHVNYSKGQHFTFAPHDDEYSAQYILPIGNWQYDHAFSNFGTACTTCGNFYRGASQDLKYGSALGDYDDHPWAAHPGLDHRQVLVDLAF